MQDLSPLIRVRACAPAVEVQSLNDWTAWEVLTGLYYLAILEPEVQHQSLDNPGCPWRLWGGGSSFSSPASGGSRHSLACGNIPPTCSVFP